MQISEENFDFTGQDRPMLVLATSQYCTAGEKSEHATDKMMRLQAQLSEQYAFGQLDIDQQPYITIKWQVKGVPSLLMVNDGKVIRHFDCNEPNLYQMLNHVNMKG